MKPEWLWLHNLFSLFRHCCALTMLAVSQASPKNCAASSSPTSRDSAIPVWIRTPRRNIVASSARSSPTSSALSVMMSGRSRWSRGWRRRRCLPVSADISSKVASQPTPAGKEGDGWCWSRTITSFFFLNSNCTCQYEIEKKLTLFERFERYKAWNILKCCLTHYILYNPMWIDIS